MPLSSLVIRPQSILRESSTMNRIFGSTGFVRNIGESDNVPGAATDDTGPINVNVAKKLATANLSEFGFFSMIYLAKSVA